MLKAQKVNKPECANCGATALMACARCVLVHYCNRDCQISNWKTHKPMCVSLDMRKPVPEEKKDGIECAICLDVLGEHITLKCGHKFHRECLCKLVGDSCPLCRRPFMTAEDFYISDIFNIFFTHPKTMTVRDKVEDAIVHAGLERDQELKKKYMKMDAHQKKKYAKATFQKSTNIRMRQRIISELLVMCKDAAEIDK